MYSCNSIFTLCLHVVEQKGLTVVEGLKDGFMYMFICFYISIIANRVFAFNADYYSKNSCPLYIQKFSKEHIFNYFFTKSTICNYITFLSSVATR